MAMDKQQHQLVEEAALWIVQLSSDDESIRKNAQLKFNQWKQNSLQHQKIAADIEQCIRSIQKVSQSTHHKKVVKSALKAGLGSAKSYKHLRAGSAFVIALLAVSGSIFYLTDNTIAYLSADIQGDSAQWTTQTLQDGSRLILRGKSAVNLDFQANQRVVELVQGQIYVDVAKDPQRPFLVKTKHGQIQALGTAFSVSYTPVATELKMLHSRVRVQAASSPYAKQQVIVSAGQAVSMNQNGVQPLSALNIYNEQQKWNKHQLMVEDLPLDQVLKELDQNYKGKILFNAEALSHIQVNAVLPLDQTQDALKLLATVFPNLKIYQITPYIIVISSKNNI
ncbi:FecR family protein [Acinetobacter colistiniresistens]|uniref:Iron ABC transporter permease n=1 Tax=Acinetobacter colistiniresistens TaxID=280145 RepID=A0A558F1X5_9GAMM|nr:FecR domain-containing protein [Acinetobacter colistiniresistens]TVT79621.1 iron ABC transporter permease [Acinetobacter colistiniresistens]